MPDIYDHFCTDLDPKALQLLWDLVKRKPIDKSEAGLAFVNIASYAMGKVLGQPNPAPTPFGARSLSDAEIDTVFADALKQTKAGPVTGPFDWVKLIMVLIQILPLIFK